MNSVQKEMSIWCMCMDTSSANRVDENMALVCSVDPNNARKKIWCNGAWKISIGNVTLVRDSGVLFFFWCRQKYVLANKGNIWCMKICQMSLWCLVEVHDMALGYSSPAGADRNRTVQWYTLLLVLVYSSAGGTFYSSVPFC